MGKSAVSSLFYYVLVACTFFLSALTIVSAFAGKFAPVESTLMPLLGLALPVLLLIDLLVAVCWFFARKVWAWLPLLAFFCNWNYLTAMLQYHPAQKRTPAGKYLKIATYNVQGFGNEITGYSCKQMASYMRQEGVDVLCFQEFSGRRSFPLDSIRRALSHWRYSITSAEDSVQGILPMAIFSRYPLENRRYITYRNSSNGGILCDVIVGTDTLRIINNHLQTTSVSQKRRKWERELAADDARREVHAMEDAVNTLHGNFLKRAEQTDSICRYAQSSPYPVLVCGDFNTLPSSYTYHRLSQVLRDGFKSAGRGYMHTYRYAKRLLRIDYIFHSPDLECTYYDSPDLELCSDHNPVLMEVRLH